MKISVFLSENFHFLVVKFSVYLNRLVFVMSHFSWSGLVLKAVKDIKIRCVSVISLITNKRLGTTKSSVLSINDRYM